MSVLLFTENLGKKCTITVLLLLQRWVIKILHLSVFILCLYLSLELLIPGNLSNTFSFLIFSFLLNKAQLVWSSFVLSKRKDGKWYGKFRNVLSGPAISTTILLCVMVLDWNDPFIIQEPKSHHYYVSSQIHLHPFENSWFYFFIQKLEEH